LIEDDFIDLTRLTDEELVARAGDPRRTEQAFGVLHFRHQDRVAGILAAKLPPELADEALQEVFIDLYEALASGRTITNVRAWLNRVAHNTVAERWRGREGRHVVEGRGAVRIDDTTGEGPAFEVKDDGGQGEAEAWMVIHDLLTRRSAAHQAVVRAFVLEGRDAKEVAGLTGETPDNVYQVSKRFRDDLRAALRGDLDTPTDDRTS